MDKILQVDPATKKYLPEFTAYFQRLLKPIDQWVLTEIIDDWRHNLRAGTTVEDFELIAQTSRQFLRDKSRDKHHDPIWLKCILFISLQRLSHSLDGNIIWAADFIETSGTYIDPNEEVLRAVLNLYNQWRDEPKTLTGGLAQPYAFYLLFEALTEDSTLRKYIEMRKDTDVLKSYFITVENGEAFIANRLTAFAADYYRNKGQLIAPVDANIDISSITHFLKLNLRDVNIDHIIDKFAEHHPAITVTTMGMMSSGKSTIIKRIKAEVTKSRDYDADSSFPITQLNYVRKGEEDNQAGGSTNFFGPIYLRTDPTGIDRIELAGEIRVNDQQYKLLFNDIRGGITTGTPAEYDKNLSAIRDKEGKLMDKKYPLECLLLQTDLLLIVMDPETIFYEDESSSYTFDNLLSDIASRLNFLFHYSKHAMIAIVFSKVDEYGSVIRGPRNLIHTAAQSNLLIEYLRNGDKNYLDQLNAAISSSYKGNTGMQRTVTLLMQSMKYLTKIVAYTKKHPALNFYLTSHPAMRDVEKSEWAGITDIFNDFADYFGWLIKTKEQSRIMPPTEVAASVDNLKITLDFLNSNHFNAICTVERKIDDGEYRIVNEGKMVYSSTRSAFTDNEIFYNTKYTYKLYFSNVSDDKNYSKPVEITVLTLGKPTLLISPPIEVACANKSDKVNVTWKNENLLPVNINISRKDSSGDFIPLVGNKRSVGADAYVDQNAEFGKNYTYKVWFFEEANPANTSLSVEEHYRTRPLKIKNLRWELKPNSREPEYIELAWDEPRNDYPTSCKIMRNFKNKKIDDTTQKSVNGNVYKDTSARKGFRYKYGVTVVDSFNDNNVSDAEETGDITIKSHYNIMAIILIAITSIMMLVLLIRLLSSL